MVVREQADQWAWYLFPDGVPTFWGTIWDFRLSINVDLDRINHLALYRPSDQMLYVIRSSDGQQVSFGPLSNVNSIPLAGYYRPAALLSFECLIQVA